jgi:hypothetical protein
MGKITLRRYTSLPFLLDILHEKRLPLLDPATWEDKNDSYYLKLYKKEKGLESLLAICFAEAAETYHHWKIYSGNSSGVCIEFNKERLLSKIQDKKEYLSRKVIYKYLHDKPHTVDKLPFIKRVAFEGEEEFRIIYTDPVDDIKVNYLPITSNDIDCIYINPWVNKSVFISIKTVINSIDGCSRIKVAKSTIVENEQWKKLGDDLVSTK